MQHNTIFGFFIARLVPAFLALAVPCTAHPVPPMSPADSLCLVGEIRLELGGAKHAIAPLEEALRIDPSLTHAYIGLGTAYVGAKRWKEAKRAFRAALSLDPALAAAHDGLGLIALYGQKDAEAARAHFEAALERAPDSAAVRYHLGLARLLAEDRNLRRAAQRTLKLDSVDAAACRVLAEYYASRDDWDRAIALYERYLKQEPADGDAAYRLGLLCLEAGRYRDLAHLLRARDRSDERRWLPLAAQAYLYEGDGMRAAALFEDYIGRLDAGEAALYRDISLVASKPELEAYARTPEAKQGAFLKRFWARHDLSVVTGGTLRWAEHCRRVWYARTHFSRAVYPWDRRGEVYVRYGEPDYRATSKKLNTSVPPQVQRIKERMAVELYGPEAVGEFYTGPVFPVRSNRAFGATGPPPEMGLTPDEVRLLLGLEDVTGEDRIEVLEQEAAQAQGREVREAGDEAERLGATRADDELSDLFALDQTLDISRIRHERTAEQTTGLYMPVTVREDASVVPWESWVYTMVAEGFEVTFTDEYFKGNYDYAPVPTHVPNELKERYVEVRDVADFFWHAPEIVVEKMAGRIPDFYDFARDARPLDFWYRTASFRGSDGRTRLEVYCGIPPDSLLGQGGEVWIERNAALLDPVADRVYRSDRQLLLAESFLRASADTARGWQNLVLDAATLEVPPGTYEFGVRVRERGRRRFQLYRQQLAVEDYNTDELMLSDIELAWSISGAEDKSGRFVKQGLRVMPMSVWAFPRGHPAFLYFEIYNLARDAFGQTRYRVTYEVRSKNAAGGAARVLAGLGRLMGIEREAQKVSVTYDQVGRETEDMSYVELGLDRAGVGDQEILITVTDLVGGQRVQKTATFGIR